MNYVCLDIETTGDQIQEKEIIELAAVRYTNGKKSDTFHSFIKPKQQVSKFILNLTQIKKEDILSAPSFKEIYHDLKAFLKKDLLIAHNINFDMTILDLEAARIDKPELSNICLDSADLSLLVLPNITKQGLKALAKHFKIPLYHQHRALHDTLCLGKIVLELKRLLCKIPLCIFNPIYYSSTQSGLRSFIKQHIKAPPSQNSTSKLVDNATAYKKRNCLTNQINLNNLPYCLLHNDQSKQTITIPPTKSSLLYILTQHPQLIALNGTPYLTEQAVKKQLIFWNKQCLLQSALLHWWIKSKDHSILNMHTRLKQSLKNSLLSTTIPQHLNNQRYILSSLEKYSKALKQNLFQNKTITVYSTQSLHSILKKKKPLSVSCKYTCMTFPKQVPSNWSCYSTGQYLISPQKTILLLEKQFKKPCLLGLFYRSTSFAKHLASHFNSQHHVRCLFTDQSQAKFLKEKHYPQLVLMPMTLDSLEHAFKFQKLVWTGSKNTKKYKLFLETLLFLQQLKKLPVIWLDHWKTDTLI